MAIWHSFVDWLVWVVDQLYNFTLFAHVGSYALAIILLTVIVKFALYPLSRSQMRSTKKMQALQPQLEEIKRKYKKKDPERMSQLTMELYKENGASPFAGCLPLLIQFPVLIGLYNALINYNYANAADAGFFWIDSLSKADPYYILPVMAGIFTYFQSKISTANPEDRTQKIMIIMMPFMIVFVCATVPSGMAIYWITFSIVGIIQQVYINRQVEKDEWNEAEAALAAAEATGDNRAIKKAQKKIDFLQERQDKKSRNKVKSDKDDDIGKKEKSGSDETKKSGKNVSGNTKNSSKSGTKGGSKSGTKKTNGDSEKRKE